MYARDVALAQAELLSRILRFVAVEPDEPWAPASARLTYFIHSRTLKEGLRLLARLALTSKVWNACSQQLLVEHIEIEGAPCKAATGKQRLFKRYPSLLQRVRRLTCSESTSPHDTLATYRDETLAYYIKHCARLESILLSTHGLFPIRTWCIAGRGAPCATSLRLLILDGVHILDIASALLCFPLIEELVVLQLRRGDPEWQHTCEKPVPPLKSIQLKTSPFSTATDNGWPGILTRFVLLPSATTLEDLKLGEFDAAILNELFSHPFPRLRRLVLTGVIVKVETVSLDRWRCDPDQLSLEMRRGFAWTREQTESLCLYLHRSTLQQLVIHFSDGDNIVAGYVVKSILPLIANIRTTFTIEGKECDLEALAARYDAL